jgi:hypothetical protein
VSAARGAGSLTMLVTGVDMARAHTVTPAERGRTATTANGSGIGS